MSAASSGSATRRIALAWLPAFSYMALIWLLSSGPVSVPLDVVPFKDKGAHIFEYGILAALNAHAILRSFREMRWLQATLLAAALTFAWGYLDEVHQAFVPGRNADAFDLLADTIGALVGSAGFALVSRLRRRAPQS